ncbi:MAG: hypothetical protein EOM93_05490 [Gammaproteobacteria bacterium]|nr:hypothetical protein [Gammaproteobacteria bacterium]
MKLSVTMEEPPASTVTVFSASLDVPFSYVTNTSTEACAAVLLVIVTSTYPAVLVSNPPVEMLDVSIMRQLPTGAASHSSESYRESAGTAIIAINTIASMVFLLFIEKPHVIISSMRSCSMARLISMESLLPVLISFLQREFP